LNFPVEILAILRIDPNRPAEHTTLAAVYRDFDTLGRRERPPSRAAAIGAKREQGYRCQGCDVDYGELYGQQGKRCVDAHHLVPFAQLGEDVRPLDPRRDFAIVCANCYRLIHSRRPEPLTVSELRALLARY
jgi:5-methylcytosine-specific restriction protein A